MIEIENQYKPKTLLENVYDMTHNRWEHISVDDFNRALAYRFDGDYRNQLRWIRIESEDEKRQLEVIHLNQLVMLMEEENFIECYNYFSYQDPNRENKIQPLFNPYTKGENRELLSIEINDQERLIVKERTLLTEFP